MASEIADAWETLQKANDELRAENARLREQAEALADALEGLVEEVWPSEMIAEGTEPEEGVSVAGPVDGGTVADARAALRAYRECADTEGEGR